MRTGVLGTEINEPGNAETAAVISTNDSRVTVRVIHTDEDLMIARSVCRVLGLGRKIESTPSQTA